MWYNVGRLAITLQRNGFMKYYTLKDQEQKEHYSNLSHAIENVLLYGGSLYDEHERLIISLHKDKEDDVD